MLNAAHASAKFDSIAHDAIGFSNRFIAAFDKITAPIQTKINYLMVDQAIARDRRANRPYTRFVIAISSDAAEKGWIPVYEKLAKAGYSVRVKHNLPPLSDTELLIGFKNEPLHGTEPGQVRSVDKRNMTKEILFDFSDDFKTDGGTSPSA